MVGCRGGGWGAEEDGGGNINALSSLAKEKKEKMSIWVLHGHMLVIPVFTLVHH